MSIASTVTAIQAPIVRHGWRALAEASAFVESLMTDLRSRRWSVAPAASGPPSAVHTSWSSCRVVPTITDLAVGLRRRNAANHAGSTSLPFFARFGSVHAVRSHINHYRGGRYTMSAPTSITITPVFVADLAVEGERMPVYVHVIDHPDARVLVDTGMTELHPAMADMDPRLQPLSEQDFDLAGIDIVVNTHLHAEHCGGNHLFAGKADLCPASGARRRAQRGRLHHSRVGRGSGFRTASRRWTGESFGSGQARLSASNTTSSITSQ